ncbi:hypothetical protein EUGRSUZ_L03479 [Eucalyptus grandis]|uniref:Uncharacterized protein n=1 Tax=Eucalyptus grandis TaxID=71139 RepID=A0AAD9T6Z0_EUCGR|nr:hypothetical protein EUGRSUZ_L03479 [Eucalyptus grandis]
MCPQKRPQIVSFVEILCTSRPNQDLVCAPERIESVRLIMPYEHKNKWSTLSRILGFWCVIRYLYVFRMYFVERLVFT